MRIVIFCHSLLSDWNHGNAHFLRGVASDLLLRGYDVRVWEPRNAWSIEHLVADHGEEPLRAFEQAYPELAGGIERYDPAALDLDAALDGADLVLVHEWNPHALVAAIGRHRAAGHEYVLLFHDTHHRSVTDRDGIAGYDLRHYDGVLAFGDVIRDAYLANGWTARAWTWHEGADVRRFRPFGAGTYDGELVWIGNWGDDERSGELHEFLIDPVRRLGLRARVYGVRYPEAARRELADAGIEYGGWLPNFEVPAVLARFRFTIHVPRRPYVTALPGIPTIRPFEALACGVPLISAMWTDHGGLFTEGRDFLVAPDGQAMEAAMQRIASDPDLRYELALHGRRTILQRHTCAHRVDELLAIVDAVRGRTAGLPAGSHVASSTQELS
jgi:spore maturation protein CgeB